MVPSLVGRAGLAIRALRALSPAAMPLYEYECLKCGERFEIIQKFSDEPYRLHSDNGGASCEGSVRKLLAAPAIQFKGSGWYVTDYGKGAKKPSADRGESSPRKEAKSSDSSGSPAKVGGKSGDAKPSRAAAAAT